MPPPSRDRPGSNAPPFVREMSAPRNRSAADAGLPSKWKERNAMREPVTVADQRTASPTRAFSARGGASLLPELLCGLDWLSLRCSPVYAGRGVTQGNGAPVVV